jgi:SAM-dependent methyltransferase
MSPAPVAAARVLELGCGDGGNLLPMAAALPGGRFVGVDLAARPVAAATAFAQAAGIANAELLVLDLADLPADLGEFDYVIAHGVYSWVPPKVRTALLAACERHLAPQGVAYVSYNAYPGSHLRDMASEILAYHVRGVSDPADRVERAHALMRMIVAADDRSPSGRVLREHMQRLLEHTDWLLLHDDLAEVNTPVYFHEFVHHARAHGLRFLAEADPTDGAKELEALEAMPADVETREQYRDFLTNRMFRQTLLCRAEVEPAEYAVPEDGLFAATSAQVSGARFELASGAALESGDPAVGEAMTELSGRWPEGVPVERLPALRDLLVGAWRAGVVDLRAHEPALVARAGERPVASAFARLQVERGADVVSSLLHTNVTLEDEGGRRLLGLLDGTRDRAGLAAEMGADDDEVDAGLAALGRLGLLES